METLQYKMLKRIIERNNPNVSKDQIELSLLDQLSLGNIDQDQYDQLLSSLVTEPIKEGVEENVG